MIQAVYNSSSKAVIFTFDSTSWTAPCSAIMEDISALVIIPAAPTAFEPYSQMTLAGLYVVDAPLSSADMQEVVDRMLAGQDTLQGCAACAAGTFKSETGPQACAACALQSSSPPASTSAAACACLVDSYGPPNGPCVACPAN